LSFGDEIPPSLLSVFELVLTNGPIFTVVCVTIG
jgi:hypothetical protein